MERGQLAPPYRRIYLLLPITSGPEGSPDRLPIELGRPDIQERMPFEQVQGNFEDALRKMNEWAGMGYDLNAYGGFCFRLEG